MNANAWQLKRLDSQDADLMRKLNVCFGQAFEDLHTYTEKPADDAYITRLLSKADVFVLVALVRNDVVGGLVAYQLEKFEQHRSEMYLYDLAVDVSFRRQGIATALIEKLKECARAAGAYEIFVQADYGDEPAIALYTSLGLREDVMHFAMSLD